MVTYAPHNSLSATPQPLTLKQTLEASRWLREVAQMSPPPPPPPGASAPVSDTSTQQPQTPDSDLDACPAEQGCHTSLMSPPDRLTIPARQTCPEFSMS